MLATPEVLTSETGNSTQVPDMGDRAPASYIISCLSPRRHMSSKLELGGKPGTVPGTPIWDARVPANAITAVPKSTSELNFQCILPLTFWHIFMFIYVFILITDFAWVILFQYAFLSGSTSCILKSGYCHWVYLVQSVPFS